MKGLPLWAHITLGIIIGFSLLTLGWTMTIGYIAKKEVEAFNEQIEEISRQVKAEKALIEAKRKVEIEAKVRAKEQARLYALAEQNRKIEQANFKRAQEYNFEQWYEKNMPDGCREEDYGDLNVECINIKIRAEREFKSKHSIN